jgi:hypothetical protein
MDEHRILDVSCRIADFLEENEADLVARLVATYRHNPGYAALDQVAYEHDLTPVALANCKLLVQRLRGLAPRPEDVATVSASGARRVSQGIPEAEVSRAYRLWSMAIWTEITGAARTLRGITSDDLVPLASIVLEHNEHAGGLASDAYEDEVRGIWVQASEVTPLEVAALAAGELPVGRLRELEAATVGPQPRSLTMVLVTAREGSGVADRNDAVRRVVSQWRAAHQNHVFVAALDQVVILIAASVRPDWSAQVDREDLALVALAGVEGVNGLDGAFAAFEETRQTLTAACHLPPRAEPYHWAETLLTCIALAIPTPVAERLREAVAALDAHEQRHGTPLRATVDCYIANNGSIARTADALFCHQNTVRYRLDQARRACGLDLFNATDRTVFAIALSLPQR